MKSKLKVFAIAFAAVMISGLMLARAAGLEFEVAAIKPTRSPLGVQGGCHGRDVHFRLDDDRLNVPLGRCVITAGRLTHIMSIAYDFDVNRITGRPDWDGPSRFDIEAKAESESTTQEDLLQMLRTLLADRFKLKVSRETKQESGFALVVARNGPKLKQARPEEESRFVMRGTGINKRDAIDGQKLPLNTVTAQNSSLRQLVEVLSRAAHGPVVDRTGLSAYYDFSLSWELDEEVSSALQQQLGLRLESQKVPVEYMTIVSAEKPTEN
jgi:uncharacterized protein (TIGR03435 family)